MPSRQSTGTCSLCGRTLSKGAMSRHLKKCIATHRPPSEKKAEEVLHLVVDAPNLPEYWMHVAARPQAMLRGLDRLLRDVWCECCGHLSEFREKQERPTRKGFDEIAQALHQLRQGLEGGVDFFDVLGGDTDGLDMRTSLAAALPPGHELEYTYDFGDSTELRVRSLGRFAVPKTKKPLEILARNNPPELRCGECGEPATAICTECEWETGGLFCKKCLKAHECGDEMALPVVNSPRTGVCGYTGPD